MVSYVWFATRAVVTGILANREVTGESDFTIYVSSADPEKFAKALKYVYNNRVRLEEAGVAGRRIIEDRYDWRKIAQEFDNYLEEFAHARPLMKSTKRYSRDSKAKKVT